MNKSILIFLIPKGMWQSFSEFLQDTILLSMNLLFLKSISPSYISLLILKKKYSIILNCTLYSIVLKFTQICLGQSTPNLLTESVCEDLQIEPPSINSNETEPTIVLDNTHLERSQSPDDVILTNNPSAIVNNDKLASDRSPSVSPVPCECLENWKEDEKSESETSPKIEKSRSPSPEKEKSRTPSPENFERGEVVMAEEEEKVPSRSPSPVKEKSCSPSPVKENSRSPSLDKEDDDDIVVVEKEVSPSASPEKEKSRSPSPVVKEKSRSPSPEKEKSRSPSPEEEKSRSSSPLVVKEKSRSPSPEKEKSRSVSPVNEKAPEKSRSPSPVDSKKSLSPVPTKSRSPSPENAQKSRSASPETKE